VEVGVTEGILKVARIGDGRARAEGDWKCEAQKLKLRLKVKMGREARAAQEEQAEGCDSSALGAILEFQVG
jgi:hypothetical protein